jgi:CBS domain containing-hemolysin-like protein
MTEAWAWVIGIGAALGAMLLAIADSALLAIHAAATDEPVPETLRAERERTHRALSMARILAYVTSGAALAQALHLASLSHTNRVAVGGFAALVAVALCEGIGRGIGYARPGTVLARSAPIIRVVRVLLAPVVSLGATLERLLVVIIPPVAANEEERETSAEQFREVVAAEADVSSDEEQLIHGVFSMGDTQVQEIMIPRVDIVGIDSATPWSEVLDRIRSSEHARFPVYEETLDDVTGILYAKDLLPAIVADEEPAGGWLALVRPAAFIPVSKRIDVQLRDFQASRTHIAIVSDEYGGTAGLVTIEDILEEIVGEIRDEYDVEEPEIQQEGTSRFWVSGRLPVDELTERLDTDFGIQDVTTVGGLVYELFGRVPRSGETLVHSHIRVVVERVRRRRIERAYFERLEPVGTSERR